MHRSWMNADRRSPEYVEGVEKFIDFAARNANNYNSLHCPCRLCLNLKFHTPNKIREHLFFHGIDESYITWIWHGEAPSVDGQIEDGDLDDARDTVEMVWDAHDHCASNPEMFKKLLEDAEKPLYIGCTKYTKLSALVKLYNLKARHGVSDKCFSDMLTLVGDMLPDHNELPLSMYEAKKAMTTLGMQYEKIHACPNDCKVKGYFAFPICSEGTDSDRLTNCKKNIYAGHRRFLPHYHPYRKQKVPFNGQSDFRSAPKPLSGEEVLRKVEGFDILRGKKNGKPRADPVGATCWKKRSIFYDLEYWKHLHVRHCLDVMHIEKNVCESIVGTLLNMPGKTKDSLNARLDLAQNGQSHIYMEHHPSTKPLSDIEALDVLEETELAYLRADVEGTYVD